MIKTVTEGLVKKSEYRDSVQLMRISNEIASIKGVEKAAAMMATDNNKNSSRHRIAN